MDVASVVERFGLSVGLLLYFIWQNYKINKEHKDDIKDITYKAVDALNKSTEAIKDNSDVLSEARGNRWRNGSGG